LTVPSTFGTTVNNKTLINILILLEFMSKNLFIVFEGIDGSGKGEMIKKTADYLFNKHLNVLVTREPSESRYGKEIRKILAEHEDPHSDAEKCFELYVNDRKEHLKNEIEPFLEKGIVISDRYYYSTIAYQSIQGIESERTMLANMGFRTPDLVLILDLPASVALERIKKVRKKEKFEDPDFLTKIRQSFLDLKDNLEDPIKIIDASKTKQEVFDQIKKEIDKLF